MAENSDDAVRWLEDRLSEMESALAPLVSVNSFTGNPEGGRQVGRMLKDLFALPGWESQVVESQKYADHLVFRSGPSASGPEGVAPVALVGHLDTVFPPDTFEGYRVDGEKRRGPGVLDMKGGLVVVAFACKALLETGGPGALPPIRLVIVSDEEVGSPEGQKVIRDAIGGAGAALVFESGREKDAIVTRRKGTGGITAVAHGKAAHAGNAHEAGANAIWAMARFVEAAQKLTDYERGVTVNVGRISGGQGKNTVPDRCEALVDFRFLTRADGEATEAALRKAAEEAAASVRGTSIELTGGVAREPLVRTEASQALMARYAECARASGLGGDEAALVGGGSDASTSSGMGIPSIDGLGPRGRGFHTVEEWIEARSLITKSQALARFLAAHARS